MYVDRTRTSSTIYNNYRNKERDGSTGATTSDCYCKSMDEKIVFYRDYDESTRFRYLQNPVFNMREVWYSSNMVHGPAFHIIT
jgi:hypothetical protein